MKDDLFGEIPFSKVNSLLTWSLLWLRNILDLVIFVCMHHMTILLPSYLITLPQTVKWQKTNALGVVAKWCKLLKAVPWTLMVWSTLALAHISPGSYPGYFMSSFHLYVISFDTLACVSLKSPSAYNMYVFNLWIENHILIIKKTYWTDYSN